MQCIIIWWYSVLRGSLIKCTGYVPVCTTIILYKGEIFVFSGALGHSSEVGASFVQKPIIRCPVGTDCMIATLRTDHDPKLLEAIENGRRLLVHAAFVIHRLR